MRNWNNLPFFKVQYFSKPSILNYTNIFGEFVKVPQGLNLMDENGDFKGKVDTENGIRAYYNTRVGEVFSLNDLIFLNSQNEPLDYFEIDNFFTVKVIIKEDGRE